MSKTSGPSRDERRQELLDAAKGLFAERGYHDTTVDDITKAANVAKGTFYLYFREKREIYHEVIKSFLELVKDFGVLVVEHNPSPADYFTKVQEGARGLLQALTENRELARLAYREALGPDEQIAQMFATFYREIAELEARNLEVAMQLGIVRKCTPLAVAYMHIGMVERLLLEVLERPEAFPPLEQLVDEMLRVGYEGLRGPNGPGWDLMFSSGTSGSSEPSS